MIIKFNDNIISLTDSLRIKISSSLLGTQSPYYHKKSDTMIHSRVIRWNIVIDYVKSNQLKSTASMNLTGGDLLMLERFLDLVVLNDWFLTATKNENGEFVYNTNLPKTFVTESGECIKITPLFGCTFRSIEIQFSPEIICSINEFKVRELIYFLKKFDPYTYSNVSVSNNFSNTNEVEHLDKDNMTDFFGKNPKNMSLNGTILDNKIKKPQQSTFFNNH